MVHVKEDKVSPRLLAAQACHSMTSNPSRHLYTCHLLGAYIQRNFIMKIVKAAPCVLICEPPELFSLEYFFNKNLLYMDGDEVCFYEIGRDGVGTSRRDGVVKKEHERWEAPAAEDSDELRKEVLELRKDIGEVRMEIQTLRGSIDVLAERSSAQNDKMVDAVDIMMQIAKWLKERFPQTQQRIPPGQGSSTVQKPPSISKPVALVSMRKPVVREVTEDEELESPARKKIKMNCPIVPPKSGSRGGQT